MILGIMLRRRKKFKTLIVLTIASALILIGGIMMLIFNS
jgi:hypothetical protein